MFKTISKGKKYIEKYWDKNKQKYFYRLGSYSMIGVFKKYHVVVGLGSNGFIVSNHEIDPPTKEDLWYLNQDLFDYFIETGTFDGLSGFIDEMNYWEKFIFKLPNIRHIDLKSYLYWKNDKI